MVDASGVDTKAPMRSPLARIERRFIDANVDRFPQWVQSQHLTLLTIVWTAGLVFFGRLARENPQWLWGSSLMLLMQWFTDSFDGSLGRKRGAGLVYWGFFMDHFLDFLFMCAVFVGWALMALDATVRLQVFLLMIVYSAFEVNAWLKLTVTKEFQITYLGVGPTEVRLIFILINTWLILVRPPGPLWVLWLLLGFFSLLLLLVVRRTQRAIWGLDMRNLQKR